MFYFSCVRTGPKSFSKPACTSAPANPERPLTLVRDGHKNFPNFRSERSWDVNSHSDPCAHIDFHQNRKGQVKFFIFYFGSF